MPPEDDVERVIARLKEALGVSLDREVAEIFDIDPSAITGWRKRGKVPEKYRKQAERAAHERMAEAPLSPSLYDLRQGYIFALIGLAADQLRSSVHIGGSDSDNDVWYGFRLYKLHGELRTNWFAQNKHKDKESLRHTYETVRRRISEGDLIGWIETLPVPMF
jgi:hypothetical protein